MTKLLLNIYIWPAFLLATLAGLIFLPIILSIYICIFGRTLASALRRAIGLYGWLLVRAVPFMAPVRVEPGPNKLPSPCIIVANHDSAIDPYLFGALHIENCFVTSWPFKIPVYGPLMRLAGYINIADGLETILRLGKERLLEGASLSIWPEGHRSRDSRLGRFRKGAFQLAFETGYPILPVSIIGSGRILSPGKRFLSPGKVRIILHDPIFPEKSDASPNEQICAMRDRAREVIKNSLAINRSTPSAHRPYRSSSSGSFPTSTCEQNPDVLES